MPITIEERVDNRRSRAGVDPGAELRYRIFGTESDVDARNTLAATSPVTYDVFGNGIQILQRYQVEVELIPGKTDSWEGIATYGPLSIDVPEFSFDTGGGTFNITTNYGTSQVRTAPGRAPLMAVHVGGAINSTVDSVEGTDIVVPVYSFTETYFKQDAQVNSAYKAALFQATGTVNNASFKGFAAGECLFFGAAGFRRPDGIWPVTFRFSCLPNVTGFVVGDITNIDKKGWEYLEVVYDYDASSGWMRKVPVHAIVHKVYRDANFAALGIGT